MLLNFVVFWDKAYMYAGNNNQEKWLLDFCQVIARFSFY